MIKAPHGQLAASIAAAASLHENQFDKGGRPYILHTIKVMHYLKDKDDDELSCIAVLHDSKEDCGIDDDYLRSLSLSNRVIDGITRLTKIKFQTHEEYLTDILKSYDACRVKLADLRHNTDIRRLKGIGEKDLHRMTKYHMMHTQIKDMIKWYEQNHLSMYSFPGDYFAQRDEHIAEVMEMFQ